MSSIKSWLQWHTRSDEQKDLFINAIESLFWTVLFFISILFWPKTEQKEIGSPFFVLAVLTVYYIVLSLVDKSIHLQFKINNKLHSLLKVLPLLVIFYAVLVGVVEIAYTGPISQQEFINGIMTTQSVTVILFGAIGFCDIELNLIDNRIALQRFLRKNAAPK